jgi:hypothetical protein
VIRLVARLFRYFNAASQSPFAFVIVLLVFFAAPPAVLLAMAAVMSVLVVPFVPWFWRVPTVLSAAMTMSREIEHRRLAMLRCTLFNTREIVMTLLAAGTYRVERLWSYVFIMRVILGGMLMIPMMLNLPTSPFSPAVSSEYSILSLMVLVFSYLYLLTEPILDVVIDGALGMLGATYSHSQMSALLNSMILRVGLWMLQVLTLLILLPLSRELLAGVGGYKIVWLTLFGPAYGIMLGLEPALTLTLLVTMLLFRLTVLQGVLRLTIWRAEVVAV